jgi:hypothetical protein
MRKQAPFFLSSLSSAQIVGFKVQRLLHSKLWSTREARIFAGM